MHFCALNCFTLKLDNGRYVITSDNGFITSIWAVESFTRQSVILHRTDSSGFSAVLTGQISKEGNRLINETWDGKASDFKLAWGTALNTVPGSNEERDRGQQPQRQVVVVRPAVVCYPWFLGMICQ
jgi:hypothetical protein